MLFGFFGRVRFKVWLLLSSDTPAQPVMVLMYDDTTQMYRTLCFSLAVIVPTSPPQAPVPVPVGHGGGGHPPVPVPALPPPPPVQAPMHVPPIVGHNGKFKCITISMEHFNNLEMDQFFGSVDFRPLFLPLHRCQTIMLAMYCKASNESYGYHPSTGTF